LELGKRRRMGEARRGREYWHMGDVSNGGSEKAEGRENCVYSERHEEWGSKGERAE
jgi:hypothetical protein